MSFISGFTELFRGKKQEAPVLPQSNLDELKQHEANLNEMMTKGGRDFRNPADANALREVRNKIASIEGQQAQQPAPEATAAEGMTQIPVENTVPQQPEEVKAA